VDLKTKFSVGDFLSDSSRQVMGKVTRVTVDQWNDGAAGIKTKVVYTVRANHSSYSVAEDIAVGIKFEGENDGIPNQTG